MNRPLLLAPNAIPRFYRGGSAIAALRGAELAADEAPEDWVGSMTTVFGEDELGLSRLADGTLLRHVAATDPETMFGPQHVARYGSDPALLVKLLDAGQRLPVHVDPDQEFARAELGVAHGKTEAWIVIGTTGDDAHVHVGFREAVDSKTLERWVLEQDGAAMLRALNSLVVSAGDAIYVPAGVPHAIGQGVLIIELQEPTDYSVLLEWEDFGIDTVAEATLGLGWDLALRCVERDALDAAWFRGPEPEGPVSSLLPRVADGFFHALRLAPAGGEVELDPGFAILVITEGKGRLGDLRVNHGETILVPYSAGATTLAGDVVAIACRPPATESIA